jgi:hypothetical protein
MNCIEQSVVATWPRSIAASRHYAPQSRFGTTIHGCQSITGRWPRPKSAALSKFPWLRLSARKACPLLGPFGPRLRSDSPLTSLIGASSIHGSGVSMRSNHSWRSRRCSAVNCRTGIGPLPPISAKPTAGFATTRLRAADYEESRNISICKIGRRIAITRDRRRPGAKQDRGFIPSQCKGSPGGGPIVRFPAAFPRHPDSGTIRWRESLTVQNRQSGYTSARVLARAIWTTRNAVSTG